MKLPINATNKEKEQLAYINSDVYTSKLYQELVEAEEREVYIYSDGFDAGKEQAQIEVYHIEE